MGIITDFFDLNSSTPEVLLEHEDPWSEFANFQCKGIDPVKLSSLLEIIGHGQYDDNLKMISPINPESETGPWVIPIPTSMSQFFGAVTEGQFAEITLKWCQTDELKLDGWSANETLSFLKEMISFFKNARGNVVQFISV